MPPSSATGVRESETTWVEMASCPICSAANHDPFETAQSGERRLHYRICRNCGAVFQSPRMRDQALEDYYRADYAAQHQRVSAVTRKELGVQAGRARHFVRLLEASRQSVRRHLDVGSSTGALLAAVARRFGCQSTGIEPAELYRQYSSGLGLAVHPSLEALAAEKVNRFDLITMGHVLEHLPRPVQYLREIRKTWLEPDGHLLLEVPNLFGHRTYEVPHLLAFHHAMLRRTLWEAGFATSWIVSHGVPRSRLIPLYLTALATPLVEAVTSSPPRRSARAVRFGRSLGMAWHRFATRLAPRWAWLPFPDPPGGSVGDAGSGAA